MVLEKVLRADASGHTGQKIYELSSVGLAGLVPIAALGGEGTTLTRVADFALGVIIPVHGHIAINYVLSDYVPKSVMGASRWGALACSGVALVGLTKLNLMGPGITATVKELWRKPATKA